MMTKNDSPVQAGDVREALGLLTRLPIPTDGDGRGAAAAWAYPVAGLVIGAIAALVGLLAHGLGLPAPLTALLCLACLAITTGALHEDGLADTADGLWGGWTKEQRLEIMKDSHIGTYGVVALIFAISARWAALWILFSQSPSSAAAAIVATATVSRAMMVAVMCTLPHARDSGLSHSVGRAERPTAIIALAIGVVVALSLTGFGAVGVLIWAAVATAALAMIAKVKIGGQTGDILGAVQQIAEITILFSLVV